MIHYLYLGHFDHEANFIRFQKRSDTKPGWYRPVVAHPLDSAVIAALLDEKGLTPETVPYDWGISFEEEGWLACNRDTGNREARDFVKRLVQRTGCDIADYTTLSLLSPDNLWPTEPTAQTNRSNAASAVRAVASKSIPSS
jgi:hypothetical protein